MNPKYGDWDYPARDLSDLQQKLHDLTFCVDPNPMWKDGKSRASLYFPHDNLDNPTKEEASGLADSVAREIVEIAHRLDDDDPRRTECYSILERNRYDRNGNRITV